jgi:hypothetical protein
MRAADAGWFLRSHAHPDLRLVNGFTDACFSFIFPSASHGQCLAGNLACEPADSLASNVCEGCWIQNCQCQTFAMLLNFVFVVMFVFSSASFYLA